jgi:sugar lactone lactonase YvrE
LHKPPGGAIAFDAAGNLYVGGNNSVAVYPPNSRKASRTITVEKGVGALAVDAAGELYVGTASGVSEYAPGAADPTTTFTIPGHVGGLALSPQRSF